MDHGSDRIDRRRTESDRTDVWATAEVALLHKEAHPKSLTLLRSITT